MPKLIPLHFVWFVNEPVFNQEENRFVPYIDSILFEKVYVEAQHISAIKYFENDYDIPLLSNKVLKGEEDLSYCVIDNYHDDDLKFKEKSSVVFFSDDYADRLNDYILDNNCYSYHKITKDELSGSDLISFVIYESPEEIASLLKG